MYRFVFFAGGGAANGGAVECLDKDAFIKALYGAAKGGDGDVSSPNPMAFGLDQRFLQTVRRPVIWLPKYRRVVLVEIACTVVLNLRFVGTDHNVVDDFGFVLFT